MCLGESSIKMGDLQRSPHVAPFLFYYQKKSGGRLWRIIREGKGEDFLWEWEEMSG